MKGVVFNLLEEFICERYGDEVYEEILDAAALETREPFIGPGTYPDADLLALVQQACDQTELSATEMIRGFGKFSFPRLAEAHPTFLEGLDDAKSFLQTVHDVIHVEVRKLHPGAYLPVLEYQDPGPDRLVMIYRSERQLCAYAVGLVEGVAAYYHEQIELEHVRCTHRGDDACEFHLRFKPDPAAAHEA